MAVPKQRKTKSRRNQRRSHIHLSVPNLVKCSKCGKLKKSHTVCVYCGYYKGKEVIDVLKGLGKKERKNRKKKLSSEKKDDKEKPLELENLSQK